MRMPPYRVVDLRSNVIDPHDIFVADATTPEEAVEKALGIVPVRGGLAKDLVARVYWQIGTRPVNMVRLYRTRQDRSPDTGGEIKDKQS